MWLDYFYLFILSLFFFLFLIFIFNRWLFFKVFYIKKCLSYIWKPISAYLISSICILPTTTCKQREQKYPAFAQLNFTSIRISIDNIRFQCIDFFIFLNVHWAIKELCIEYSYHMQHIHSHLCELNSKRIYFSQFRIKGIELNSKLQSVIFSFNSVGLKVLFCVLHSVLYIHIGILVRWSWVFGSFL